MLIWSKRNYALWKLHDYDPKNLREGTSVDAMLDQTANAFTLATRRCPRYDQATVNDIKRSMNFVLNEFPGLSASVVLVCRGGVELTVTGPNVVVSVCNLSPSEYERRVR